MNLVYRFSIVASFLGLWITSLLPESFELIFGFILIFSFGMIHGSNDIMIVNALNMPKKSKPFKVLLTYLLVVSLAVLVFYILPSVALGLFVLFSAYHFGEQHWNTNIKSWSNPLKRLFFFSYGLLVLFLIFNFNIESVKKIVIDITGVTIENFYAQHTIIAAVTILVTLTGIHAIKQKIDLKSILKELVSLLVLIVIFKSSTLIWGFCIYFILWHSIPSLLDQITFIYGDFKKKNIMKYTMEALPYWIVSLIGITALYLFFKDDKHFYSLFFAFIAAVTFPHAFVMLKMFSKQSQNKKSTTV
jgi:Brp/Blh family beta-carotene 15,15'-monooxygenase